MDAPTVPRGAPEELACGIDTVDVAAFERVMKMRGPRFLRLVFTPAELAYCGGKVERLAARFAAKEAVIKALDAGLAQIPLSDIHVRTSANGAPHIVLVGAAAARARELGLRSWAVSLSHTPKVATAMAVASRTVMPPTITLPDAIGTARGNAS